MSFQKQLAQTASAWESEILELKFFESQCQKTVVMKLTCRQNYNSSESDTFKSLEKATSVLFSKPKQNSQLRPPLL